MAKDVLLGDLEAEMLPVEIPPKVEPILDAGQAGKDEPAARVWVNAISPEELRDLNEVPVDELARGFRKNGDAQKREREKQAASRRVKWCKAIIAKSEGFTLGNINYLLRSAKLVIDLERSPTLRPYFKEIDGRLELNLADLPEFAALLIEKCEAADFDQVIFQAARAWAKEYADEHEGNGRA